jgi:hypothetical protein
MHTRDFGDEPYRDAQGDHGEAACDADAAGSVQGRSDREGHDDRGGDSITRRLVHERIANLQRDGRSAEDGAGVDQDSWDTSWDTSQCSGGRQTRPG